jgi:hypothetical protein
MSSQSSHTRPVGPARGRGLRALAVVLAAGACGGHGETGTVIPAPGSLAEAVQSLRDGDYATGTARLQRLAARCESGSDGRRAVLLLAVAALDPRNPAASPDRGAELTARYLTLPGAEPAERVEAEGLYLLANSVGGRVWEPVADSLGEAPGDSVAEAPGDTAAEVPRDTVGPMGPRSVPAPPPAPVQVASRFQRCGAAPVGLAAVDPAVLPTLPDSVVRGLPAVERDSLRTRVGILEAELDRIRRLLQEGLVPDTTNTGGRP